MPRIFLLLVFVFVSALQMGCPESQPQRPVLKVGMDPAIGFPFIYKVEETEKWGGFEFEIAQYLADKAGHQLEVVETRWEALFDAVSDKKIDLALNAIEKPLATDEMELPPNILYTEHYYTAYQKLVVPQSDTFTYSLSDLKGKKIGVIETSVSEVLLNTFNRLKDAKVEIQTYLTADELFEALKANEIHASMTERALASWYSWKHPELKMTGEPITSAIPYVGLVHQEQKQLFNRLNQVFKQARKDPDFQKIFNKWHVSIKQ